MTVTTKKREVILKRLSSSLEHWVSLDILKHVVLNDFQETQECPKPHVVIGNKEILACNSKQIITGKTLLWFNIDLGTWLRDFDFNLLNSFCFV